MGFSPLEALLNFSWCELICRKNLSDNLSSELLHQSLASGLYGPSKIELVTGSSNSGGGGVGIQPFEDSDSSFQYVLTAPTSIATKVKIFGIMEGKRSSGLRHIFTLALDRLLQVRLGRVNVKATVKVRRNSLIRFLFMNHILQVLIAFICLSIGKSYVIYRYTKLRFLFFVIIQIYCKNIKNFKCLELVDN